MPFQFANRATHPETVTMHRDILASNPRPRLPLAVLLISISLSGCQLRYLGAASEMGELADKTRDDTTVTDVVATVDASGREAGLVSAFSEFRSR